MEKIKTTISVKLRMVGIHTLNDVESPSIKFSHCKSHLNCGCNKYLRMFFKVFDKLFIGLEVQSMCCGCVTECAIRLH